MISAVLWDYGGVFSDSPFAAVVGVARELGVAPERYFEVIFGPYHEDTGHPWHRLERGELALDAARREILELGRRQGFEADPVHFFTAMARRGGGARAEVVELARRVVRRGVRAALVTNNVAEFREHWRRTLPVEELFHHVVDSSEVGVRKPDPRIFELALERLGVPAERVVFLDDFEGNLEAARRVGIRGIRVDEDYRAALDELTRLLG